MGHLRYTPLGLISPVEIWTVWQHVRLQPHPQLLSILLPSPLSIPLLFPFKRGRPKDASFVARGRPEDAGAFCYVGKP